MPNRTFHNFSPFFQNPVFEEDFVLQVADPACDDLSLKVVDDKTGLVLGLAKIVLSDLLPKPDAWSRPRPVKLVGSKTDAQIIMGMRLRFPTKD